MKKIVCIAAVLVMLSGSAVAGPFDQYPGRWSGQGEISMMGHTIPMKCNMTYFLNSEVLTHTLRCRSPMLRIETRSDIRQVGDDITGTWKDNFGMSGRAVGTHKDNRFLVNAKGFVSAFIDTTTIGDTQTIKVTSKYYKMKVKLRKN